MILWVIHTQSVKAWTEKNLNEERRMLLKWVLKKWDGVDCIKLAVDMDDWGGHKKMATDNLCVPFKSEIFLIVSATTTFWSMILPHGIS
jgi:hypothetical protein